MQRHLYSIFWNNRWAAELNRKSWLSNGLIGPSMAFRDLLWSWMAFSWSCIAFSWSCMAFVWSCIAFLGLLWQNIDLIGLVLPFLGVIDPNSVDLVSKKTYYYWIKAIQACAWDWGSSPLKFKECDYPPLNFLRVSPPWRKPLDGASVKTLP